MHWKHHPYTYLYPYCQFMAILLVATRGVFSCYCLTEWLHTVCSQHTQQPANWLQRKLINLSNFKSHHAEDVVFHLTDWLLSSVMRIVVTDVKQVTARLHKGSVHPFYSLHWSIQMSTHQLIFRNVFDKDPKISVVQFIELPLSYHSTDIPAYFDIYRICRQMYPGSTPLEVNSACFCNLGDLTQILKPCFTCSDPQGFPSCETCLSKSQHQLCLYESK